MKNKGTITTAVLSVILKLSSLSLAQVVITPDSLSTPSNHIVAFFALLRDFDLNEETQNEYAITEVEYEQLKTAWECLSQPDKLKFLHCPASEFWTGSFVTVLLFDLCNNKTWEAHFNNVTDYGIQGLSLTLSRFNRPVGLSAARKTLVDLLCTGSSMVKDGKLKIDEKIKTQATERAGVEARHRLEKWEQLLNDDQKRSLMDKLKAVNEFFNHQIIAQADKGPVKGYDYWQSPIETLVRGKGDCDDFAMAKYVSLRLLGIPSEQLRIAVVKSSGSRYHAVLFCYPQNETDPWVLDNLNFKHLGGTDSHILRLSMRITHHKMEPIRGINENHFTEFQRGLSEKVTMIDPRHSFPNFGTALMNSQRLLPPGMGSDRGFTQNGGFSKNIFYALFSNPKHGETK
ncbi:transglutaminase-like cysteine peptidase [candidate division KSB1 bacterium]|nr:transglutaminase-like cysteine peptidase [candidate division KSB1 bacterium]